MVPHPRGLAIVLAVLWLVSRSVGSTEAGIILQTPAGLNPGDHFRFVFVTDGISEATSTNIADYDSFVNTEAGGATYNGAVVNWLAIGSTGSVNAIDHVGQASTPVYLSNGTLATTSTSTTGLWSGTLVHQINLDLAANIVPPVTFVWTGTNPTGTGFGGPLGSATPQTGANTDTASSWIASGRSPNGDLRNLYAISSDLAVPQSVVPEPATLTMLGTALSVGLAIGWTRRRDRRRHRPEAETGVRSSAPLNCHRPPFRSPRRRRHAQRLRFALGSLIEALPIPGNRRTTHQEAHDLLRSIYAWFTEGFDTKDLKDAKALLEELGY